jgi:chromosome segregation protein
MAVRQPLENKTEANKKATDLRREISRLGNPNIGAIEEYERVNSRYTFLTDQRDDIQKSKDELLGIIDDITSQMKDVFAEKFEEIRTEFKKSFLDLFGGGKADLELEDREDILNCGIEIKVQPPGKSLKTITLLSGGEKAFVAIALYFAILRVRPTPFVVMDEIEAALDEANVTKFARRMRDFTDKTQFLVITHRRGTMEEADVLYGVTMQEQGVSQVLMIDLEEAEKTISA